MKILSLNIWGGHVHEPLLDFLSKQQETDVICLQEVYHKALRDTSTDDRKVYLNILTEINAVLPNHRAYFRPAVDGVYGIAMLVGPKVEVLNEGVVNVYHNPEYVGIGPAHDRELQYAKILFDQKEYCIMNFHGLWNGKGKTDSPSRIEQAKNVKNFMNSVEQPIVLIGDFNMRPDTESLKNIESNMRNLISENNIKSTRTSFYKKAERFADYAIVSPEINIKQFSVLPDEVSDHAALFLEAV